MSIFQPKISKVARGMQGKAIVIYGSNNLGKTLQATRMSKPYYMGFENGLNARDGVPYELYDKWSQFKKDNKDLTDPKTVKQAREMYDTIIIDQLYAAGDLCQRYICNMYGVKDLSEKSELTNGNLYKLYEKEFSGEFDKLLKAGYTLVFIAHPEFDKDTEKLRPRGDKRSTGFIVNNADIVVYLQSNGVDENGKLIKSSAYFNETPEFFARSKFDYIVPYLEEFTAENLEKAITDAVEAQAKAEGFTTISLEEKVESLKTEELDYEELLGKIKTLGMKIYNAGHGTELSEIIEKHTQLGMTVKDLTKVHVEAMSVIAKDLEDFLIDIE